MVSKLVPVAIRVPQPGTFGPSQRVVAVEKSIPNLLDICITNLGYVESGYTFWIISFPLNLRSVLLDIFIIFHISLLDLDDDLWGLFLCVHSR